MNTIEINGITYQHCRTQTDIDAVQSEDSDIYVDFDKDEDAKIRDALDVRVKACRSLDATGAKIGGSIDATGAKIGGSINATGAKISGDLYAYGAEIGGYLDASCAKIGGYLYASGAKISGDLYAYGAEIGGYLDASNAKISGDLYASGAKIGGVTVSAPTTEQISLLDRLREDLLPVLDMRQWHGPDWNPDSAPGMCGTTHCLAGGAQALSEDPEIRRMEPDEAGLKLLPCCAHLFFAPQETVERYLREREYAK